MGFKCWVFLTLLVVVIGILFKKYKDIERPREVPALDFNYYWGPGDQSKYKEDPSLRLHRIQYSDDIIDDLRYKIGNFSTFTPPLEGIAFEYGFNTNELQKIVNYWKNDYLKNWRKREEYLNTFPHYRTQIQGLDIHYIHVKPKSTTKVPVYPILLLHGWPGSVREFYELIPKLVTESPDKNFVFEVIVPSLPGYGWSQGSSKPGLDTSGMAVIFRNLMFRLGHKRFFIQGGDWGSFIGGNMAAFFPDNVIGYHSNMCGSMTPMANIKLFIASLCPKHFVDEQYVDWIFPVIPKFQNLLTESGYMHIQATKPDTIGTVLLNNPVGLCAYILEKFSTWTNLNYREQPDGGLTKYYTLDALLDNIMIYYLTDSITTSVRLYSEVFTKRVQELELDRIPIIPPAGCARFKYEIMHSPDFVIRDKYTNLIHSTWKDDGGHFAAMQLPNVLYEDVISFIKKIKV